MRIAACILIGSMALVAGCGTLARFGVDTEDEVLMAGARELFCDQVQAKLAARETPYIVSKEALGKIWDAGRKDAQEGSELVQAIDELVAGNAPLAAALDDLVKEYLAKLKPAE